MLLTLTALGVMAVAAIVVAGARYVTAVPGQSH
jgi:hypothetical protein